MLNLSAKIYEFFENNRQTNPDKLHPSSLGSCMRKAMYQYHEEEDRKSDHPIRWSQTHPMDLATKAMLYRFGWYEKPFEDSLDAAFQTPGVNERWSWRTDILIPSESAENTWDVVDVKSVSPWAPSGGLPYAHHLPQIHAYYVLLNDHKTIRDAYLCYITRWKDGEIPDIYEFKVTPNEQEIEDIKALMREFEDWSERDELPPKPYANPEEHAWDCTYHIKRTNRYEIRCPYFAHCWPDHLDDFGGYRA
jgi:hypothetical protein